MSSYVARARKRKFTPRVHQDSSSSDDELDYAFEGSDSVSIRQRKIERMKRLRDKYDWDIQKERHRFLDDLSRLTNNFQVHYPDFHLVFQPDRIDRLVIDSIELWSNDPRVDFKACRFIEFARRSGFIYEVDQKRKPISLLVTPIHMVARRRVPREVSGLDALYDMYSNYNANCTDEDGWTHFHIACMYGLANVVSRFLSSKLLPQLNANLVWAQTGDSPLNLALGTWAPGRLPRDRCVEATLRTLLEACADPNLANKKGESALHIFSQQHFNNVEEVAQLLFKRCDEIYQPVRVDAQDVLGNTPLHLAVGRDDLKMIELLLINGASPNVANNEGCTPLHRATAKLSHATVELLLAHGADLSNFAIPFDSYFLANERLAPRTDECSYDFKVKLASSLFIIIESLEDRDYELNRSQAMHIMRFFAHYGLLARPREIPPRSHPAKWYFKQRSGEIEVKPNLSLRALIQLSPSEAEKLVAYKDYQEFASCSKLSRLKFIESREACARHLCEKMSCRFFRLWALYPFWELTDRRLPLKVCEIILARLGNEDLYRICLASPDKRQANLQ
uniref:Uncharacterized protein n=1 Tax=Trichogramma kaykai TaxID=54128 RepID=A0ABD2WQA3_9HYME